jgi:hypothetical protein
MTSAADGTPQTANHPPSTDVPVRLNTWRSRPALLIVNSVHSAMTVTSLRGSSVWALRT